MRLDASDHGADNSNLSVRYAFLRDRALVIVSAAVTEHMPDSHAHFKV